MNYKKVLLRGTLVLSLVLSTVSTGCSVSRDRTVDIFILDQSDIIVVSEGDTIVAPKKGAFLSDHYIQQVMKARVDK